MKFKFDRTRYNEAFLYMSPMEAYWASEYGSFSKDAINAITSKIVRYDSNLFARTFLNEDHLKKRFREKFTHTLHETLEAETRYRLALQAGKTEKAVTAARNDINNMTKGIDRFREFLRFNPAKGGPYLESLRRPCRETTLNLLHNMSAQLNCSKINFLAPFTHVLWEWEDIEAMQAYFESMVSTLQLSVTRGKPNKKSASPVITQFIFELGVLYWQYFGSKPGRTITTRFKDTNDDVETEYTESGLFKDFCILAINLLEKKIPEDLRLSSSENHHFAFDTPIRNAVKSLKDLNLTGP